MANQPPRINIGRLAKYLLLLLVLPFAIAIPLDLLFGWMPLLTLIAVVVFIPLSTVVVIRIALEELNRVLQMVAPPTDEDIPNLNASQKI